MTKKCKYCSIEKDVKYFSEHPGYKSGYESRCKACKNARCYAAVKKDPERLKRKKQITKEWTEKNKERKKLKSRENHLKRKFGITLKDYETMLLLQGNACYICKRDRSQFKANLAVDHNHKTGKIRKLLCYHCNYHRVGKQTLEWAEKILNYLKEHE